MQKEDFLFAVFLLRFCAKSHIKPPCALIFKHYALILCGKDFLQSLIYHYDQKQLT
jgi:hypothetical protein